MKKRLSVIVVAICLGSFIGCGGVPTQPTIATPSTTSQVLPPTNPSGEMIYSRAGYLFDIGGKTKIPEGSVRLEVKSIDPGRGSIIPAMYPTKILFSVNFSSDMTDPRGLGYCTHLRLVDRDGNDLQSAWLMGGGGVEAMKPGQKVDLFAGSPAYDLSKIQESGAYGLGVRLRWGPSCGADWVFDESSGKPLLMIIPLEFKFQ